MGWLFSTAWNSKKAVVDHLCNENGLHTIAKTVRGNVLWAVQDVKEAGAPNGKPFIMCYLLGKERGDGWGYKDMDEGMGPCYYTCPVSYFDLVPAPPNECAREWRDKVRRALAASKATKETASKLKPGDVVQLHDGCQPPQVRIKKVGRSVIGEYQGSLYRVKPALIVGVIKEES